jgi:hypothetical protein
MPMPVSVKVGDVAKMRKPHPCGGFEWEVIRVGADIGLRCLKCSRRVMLERPDFERRLKSLTPREQVDKEPD